MIFDEISWHDGQIRSIILERDEQERSSYGIRIEADVYQSMESGTRVRISIQFSEIKTATMSHNISEMEDNLSAGNISNGYKKGNSNYIIYLVDGYLDIDANKINIRVL